MDIHYDQVCGTSVVLSQSAYVDQIVAEFQLSTWKTPETPMASHFLSDLETRSDPEIDNCLYRQIIGSLLFVGTRTRPDILCATSILSRFVSKPTEFLMRAAKRVVAYLNGTKEFGLMYKSASVASDEKLLLFCDSDFAGDKDRKSRTGYCCTLFGCLFEYCSRKQPNVTLSTAEAEYVSLSEVCKEAKYLQSLLNELQVVDGPLTVLSDSQAAMSWAN